MNMGIKMKNGQNTSKKCFYVVLQCNTKYSASMTDYIYREIVKNEYDTVI